MKRVGFSWVVAAAALVLAADFPWGDLQLHTHWAKVGWIPFVTPPIGARDIVQNILLGGPLGAAVALRFRRPLLPAVLITAVVSCAGEWTQLYSHQRFPSSTDIACNIIGAALTAAAVRACAARRVLEVS